jgi:hypothetical protein
MPFIISTSKYSSPEFAEIVGHDHQVLFNRARRGEYFTIASDPELLTRLPGVLQPPKYTIDYTSRYSKNRLLGSFEAIEKYYKGFHSLTNETASKQGESVTLPWQNAINYLYARDSDTLLPELVNSIISSTFELLVPQAQTIKDVGGILRRLENPHNSLDIQDSQIPLYLRTAGATLLCLSGPEGNLDNEYEVASRRILADQMIYHYNHDQYLPLPRLGDNWQELMTDTIASFFQTLSLAIDSRQMQPDGSFEIFITDWDRLWQDRAMHCMIYGRDDLLDPSPKYGFPVIRFRPDTIHAYKITIQIQAPKANRKWNRGSIMGGVVNETGEYLDINLHIGHNPDSERFPELAHLDHRHGQYAQDRQNRYASWHRDGRLEVPLQDPDDGVNFDALAQLPAQEFINRAYTHMGRMIRYATWIWEFHHGASPLDISKTMTKSLDSLYVLGSTINFLRNKGYNVNQEKLGEFIGQILLSALVQPKLTYTLLNHTMDELENGFPHMHPRPKVCIPLQAYGLPGIDRKIRRSDVLSFFPVYEYQELGFPENGSLRWTTWDRNNLEEFLWYFEPTWPDNLSPMAKFVHLFSH